ncbi:MAG: prepilin-type N-terminal cleavage/methylation domain-containing protein [Candidatus Methylomirabilales bacterium]
MRYGKNKKGLTLVEVLIAASILAITLLGVVAMFPSAYENVKYGGRISRATALAREMLETLRNEPFAILASYHTLDTSACGAETDPIATTCQKWRDDIDTVGLPSGTGSVAICIAPCTATNDLAQITVTVGWSERTGAKTVQLVTYAAQF